MYWPRYVSVAERRKKAAKQVAKLKKGGRRIDPVTVKGRKLATTFWGEAWCRNLEEYSDYDNRLPRGRSYLRNGSVVHLEIEAGRVSAMVSGSSLYQVSVDIKPLADKRWKEIKKRCAGQIGSLVDLLKGSLSGSVMEVVTDSKSGLFPSSREISLGCSCPDWARMCKHVAAVLYGIGARLDERPELLFTLRGLDPSELVEAAVLQPVTEGRPRNGRVLEADDLASMFGIEIDPTPEPPRPRKASKLEGQVLKVAQAEGRLTSGSVMERFGMTRPRAKAMLEQMAGRGVLRRVGSRGRGVHYVKVE